MSRTPRSPSRPGSPIERARRLKPKEPLVYRSFGAYYASVDPDSPAPAAEYEQGVRLAPDNVGLLGALANTELSLGRWDSASARLARAALLDPRSSGIPGVQVDAFLALRQYPKAEAAADRALALAPTNTRLVERKVMVELAQGRLDSARAVIRAAGQRIDATTLLSYVSTFYDLYWVLDDAQQRQVLTLRPSAYDDDRGGWGIVLAQLYHLRGDRARSAVYADSARIAFEEQIRANPDDAQRHVILGLVLAYLGRKADAIREGQRGVAMSPDQPGRSQQHLLPAPARPDLPPGRRAGEGAGPARVAAQDPVLPLARLAPHRSHLRPAANQPTLRRLVEGTA